MSKAEITTHDTSEEPDGAQLTVEQLEAVAAGYQIWGYPGGGYAVADSDTGAIVATFETYEDARTWTFRHGDR
jgi:hypothetical protein